MDMIALVIHEDGKRRMIRGETWKDLVLQLSCADISVTIIKDCDFDPGIFDKGGQVGQLSGTT